MKLHIGDIVRVILKPAMLELKVKVEDASKSDEIQGKVESISDVEKNASATFTYEIGQVYMFSRADIESMDA